LQQCPSAWSGGLLAKFLQHQRLVAQVLLAGLHMTHHPFSTPPAQSEDKEVQINAQQSAQQ
jgi:hypothetical protein